MNQDIFNIRRKLKTSMGELDFTACPNLKNRDTTSKTSFSIRIMLENALRGYDDFSVTREHVDTILNWKPKGIEKDIAYKPARVLMQDFTVFRRLWISLRFVQKLQEKAKNRPTSTR